MKDPLLENVGAWRVFCERVHGVCLFEVRNWAAVLVLVHLGGIHMLSLELRWPSSLVIPGSS